MPTLGTIIDAKIGRTVILSQSPPRGLAESEGKLARMSFVISSYISLSILNKVNNELKWALSLFDL